MDLLSAIDELEPANQLDSSDESSSSEAEPQPQLQPQVDHDSVLAGIKRRLQSIPETFNLGTSILTQAVQKLPQLAVDESEFEAQDAQDTQPIDRVIQPIDRVTDTQPINKITESDKENYQPLSKEARLAKIQQLAAIKKQQRLEREQQEKAKADKDQQLHDELTKSTLTDEENDLNDINDSIVSNANANTSDHISTKELLQAEEFLNIQKRHRDIRPEFQKKVVFTKEKLLNAFEDDENPEKPSSPLDLEPNNVSSPHTSPVQNRSKSNNSHSNSNFNLSSSDEEDEELDVLALINKKPVIPPPTQSKNPIERYAQDLKRQLLSSPTKSDQEDSTPLKQKINQKVINLDDSDSDTELNPLSSPLSNQNQNQNLNSISTNKNKPKFIIPELSKDQKIAIKQKFFKKKLMHENKLPSNIVFQNLGHKSIAKDSKDFFLDLQRANIMQLKANKSTNTDNVILEEMEKDEEVMGSLLEQEMERVRRIRMREKLREKAKLALLGKKSNDEEDDEDDEDFNEDGNVPESDVPESEVPDSEYESDNVSENGSGESHAEEEDEEVLSKRKAKRIILSEDEEPAQDIRYDDSYMFGGKRTKESDNKLSPEELITTGESSQTFKIDSTSTQIINDHDDDDDDNNSRIMDRNDSYVLFQNLKPRDNTSQVTEIEDLNNKSFTEYQAALPSFKEISAPNTQNDLTYTQVDSMIKTQVDTFESTQIDQETQVIVKPIQPDEEYEEDDDITPSKVRSGRKLVRKNQPVLKDIGEEEEAEEEEEEEEDQEAIQLKIKMYEEKIRRQELKQRKRRKEMERRGIKDMVEGEAEESEDEWKGLGGIEGELSDQANSEDERMIDNDLNIDLKDEEIRKKFMEEYQIKDQKELEKLLDDIKNHRLTKKVGNGLDLELSDEEDQLLAAYRRQRLKEQRERLAESKQVQALLKSEKAKAFFKEEAPTVIRLDDSDEDSEEGEEGKKEDEQQQQEEEDVIPAKKTIKVGEAFVQRQLSFLHKKNDNDYDHIQRISNMQHGFISSDEDAIDIKELKSKSLSNLTSKRSESPPVELETNSRKRSIESTIDTDVDDDDDEDNVDDSFMPSFKKPSIISSFKSFQEQQGISIKDGKKHFSGVTISKQYKVASGSKASITYMSKKGSNKSKSLKERKIQRSLNSSQSQVKRIFTNEGFE
ncbi:MRC1-like domain-containing protein [Scheffersomyces amazonensis]|uniref:MRC1-like domain-containing protein n=1 Tax=Scheffersomyces amazonensis TaxID=1078765 RepID=UPI00315D9765